MAFVKDEANGHTRSFVSAAGSSWTLTVAPKEYMALASLRTNRPTSHDFEVTTAEYSDMTYVIAKTADTQLQLPFECESFFLSGCGDKEPAKALMCQQVISGTADGQEFLLGFPPVPADCADLCFYTIPEGSQAPEKLGCIKKSEMKTLPSIKLY